MENHDRFIDEQVSWGSFAQTHTGLGYCQRRRSASAQFEILLFLKWWRAHRFREESRIPLEFFQKHLKQEFILYIELMLRLLPEWWFPACAHTTARLARAPCEDHLSSAPARRHPVWWRSNPSDDGWCETKYQCWHFAAGRKQGRKRLCERWDEL